MENYKDIIKAISVNADDFKDKNGKSLKVESLMPVNGPTWKRMYAKRLPRKLKKKIRREKLALWNNIV